MSTTTSVIENRRRLNIKMRNGMVVCTLFLNMLANNYTGWFKVFTIDTKYAPTSKPYTGIAGSVSSAIARYKVETDGGIYIAEPKQVVGIHSGCFIWFLD